MCNATHLRAPLTFTCSMSCGQLLQALQRGSRTSKALTFSHAWPCTTIMAGLVLPTFEKMMSSSVDERPFPTRPQSLKIFTNFAPSSSVLVCLVPKPA